MFNNRLPITNNHLPIMSIDNPTLAHFRHFRHFRSLLTIFPSTTVERSLQITPFLTNKANFQKSQMNVSDLSIREYEQKDTWSSGKNKPKTKPIQSQYKANSNPIQTQNKPKTNPKQTQYKANSSQRGPCRSRNKDNFKT